MAPDVRRKSQHGCITSKRIGLWTIDVPKYCLRRGYIRWNEMINTVHRTIYHLCFQASYGIDDDDLSTISHGVGNGRLESLGRNESRIDHMYFPSSEAIDIDIFRSADSSKIFEVESYVFNPIRMEIIVLACRKLSRAAPNGDAQEDSHQDSRSGLMELLGCQ